jgi:hypothetical protein
MSRRTGAVLIPSLAGKLCMGGNDDEVLAFAPFCAAMMAATAPAAGQKKYGPGVSDAEIKIGNTMPYSGPASSYSNVSKAMSASFDKTENRCTFFRIMRWSVGAQLCSAAPLKSIDHEMLAGHEHMRLDGQIAHDAGDVLGRTNPA